MRRLLLTVTCILFLAVLLAGFAMAADKKVPVRDAGKVKAVNQDSLAEGPTVFFPQTSYTFETVLEGDKIEHSFLVENRGAAPLRIGRVKPD